MRLPFLMTLLVACGGRGCGGCNPDDTGHTAEPCSDEDMSVWFEDNDDDGHGDAAASVEACEQPDGAVSSSDDCDDGDGAVWDEGAVYLDADGDGYGAGDSVEQCGLPDGYAAVNADCDDAAAEVHPDAEVICGNGTDEDCDGQSDCAGSDVTDPADLIVSRIEGDGGAALGASVLAPGDLDQDGQPELSIGAPDQDGAGAAYLFFGVDAAVLQASEADAVAMGTGDGIQAGAALALAELSGDGVLDWIVSAPDMSTGVGGASVYVVHGPLSGSTSLEDGASVTVIKSGTGWSVDAGVDYRGSDDLDLLLSNDSAVVLIQGPLEEGEYSTSDLADGAISAGDADDGQRVVFAGDVTGDGLVDVLYGAPEDTWGSDDDPDRDDAGNVFLIDDAQAFRDGLSGDETAHDLARVSILGEMTGSHLGAALSPAGDVDGDGYADVLVGAPSWRRFTSEPDAGAAYLYSGADLTGLDAGAVLAAEDGEARVYGAESWDELGTSVAGGADLDGDGTPDIVVGVPGYDGDLGAALVWFGAPRGEQEIGDADLTLTGEATGDRFGQAVDAGGDFNGLGWDDLVVGAPGAGGGDGAVFVLALDRL